MAWSYSALSAFETCPRRFYHTRVKKDVEDPPGEAALWGQRVHKHLEDRLRDGTPLPHALRIYEPYAKKVALAGGDALQVEQKVALDTDLKPCEYFSKAAWLRGVLDVVFVKGETAFIFDWKTGRRKHDMDQLALFAAIGRQVYPAVERFKTAYIWLKEKKLDQEVFTRDQLSDVWSRFLRRAQKIDDAQASGEYPPKPSGLCRRHCPVTTCEYHGG